VEIALRTQQIIAEETGVANTIDPLAGSYFVESLTNDIEEKTWDYIHKIDDMGGMIAAIERGFPQMEIADAAYHYQRQIDGGEKIMVGMNKYVTDEAQKIPLLDIDDAVEQDQIKRLSAVRRKRNNRAVTKSLNDLKSVCKSGGNVMPCCIEAVRQYASVQEICDIYREVFGEYHDPGLF
jgi:methylmalonyl-CoA mutase N-terminal domain/subunit